MNEYEKLQEKIAKEVEKEEQAKNRKKVLMKQANDLKRKASTKRKIEKGGAFETFERQFTGMQEETSAKVIEEFLKYVFYKDEYKEKLIQITDKHLKQKAKTTTKNTNE